MGESERYVLLPIDESERPTMKKKFINRSKLCTVGTALNIALSVVSVASLVTTGVVIHKAGGFETYRNLLTETTYNSPAAKELRPTWSTVLQQPSRLESPEGVYRQVPNSDVDAAWGEIANPPFIVLSAAEVRGLGKDPAVTAQPPEDWGLYKTCMSHSGTLSSLTPIIAVGPDVYLGTVDVYHQLHCLDMLRMNLHDNFDHYHSKPLSPLARAHVSHCVESLMKTLMCQPSLDILTTKWTDSIGGLGPAHLADFDFNRKCWDFEQLNRWTEGRRVDITDDMMRNLTPPAGTTFQSQPLEVEEALAGMWGE
ncbi:hypothetical protein NUW58_g3858 [Xylaria curta]|uniref:Uncharacterized protein n=1 Tax=Xylaria curta TaxID=42375 RepID=A0ACC1P932_9PEZI|nr:hypothetical protein NUW58_g3858 [Xylaria curta]